MNTLDWIAKWADYTPTKKALSSFDTDEQYSYLDVHTYANRLVEKLVVLGLEEGDRIAVLAEHSIDYIVLFSACQRMGAILVPLNYRLTVSEISKLLKDCNPKLLIYSEKQEIKKEKLELHIQDVYSFSVLKKQYKSEFTPLKRVFKIKENNPLFIFYTSGTTGKPKGVIYTNKMLFWNSLNTSMQLGITFRDSTINTLPPYHTSGWNIFVTPLLHKGAHIGMLEKFDADKILCLLELNQISLFMALPTMLQVMQKSSVFKNVNLNSLRYIISGGESVSAALVSHWKEEKNIYIRPGYGLTEAGPSITSLHHKMTLLKPNSIGKPNFYLETKIINNLGKEVEENELGELCIRGEVVTPGYWNDSVKTNEQIKNNWLLTGDFVYKDADGYLYLKGRKNDMYISGGENIYPQEIELQLEEYSVIKKAVILSVDDEKWGQCGIAFVTVNNRKTTLIDIYKYLNKTLVSYKHPKHLFILDEIPVTTLGKVSRKKLLQYYNSLKINE